MSIIPFNIYGIKQMMYNQVSLILTYKLLFQALLALSGKCIGVYDANRMNDIILFHVHCTICLTVTNHYNDL